MEKWIQTLLSELNGLREDEVREKMKLLEYGPPTSPRYRIVEHYLNHLPKPLTGVSKGKTWYRRISEIVLLGAAGSLLAWLILHFLGFA